LEKEKVEKQLRLQTNTLQNKVNTGDKDDNYRPFLFIFVSMYVTEKIVRWLNWRYDGTILIYDCAAFEWTKTNQMGVFFVRLEVEKYPFLQDQLLKVNTNTILNEKNIEEVVKKYFSVQDCYTRDCDRSVFAAYLDALEKNLKLKYVKNVYPRV
jgi:hypothetical protein